MDVVSQETKEKIAVCFGIVACLATIYWGLDWNHWSQIPEEIRLLSGFDWAEFLDLSSLHKVIPENSLEFLVSIPVTGSRIIEVLIFAGINTLLSTLLSIWGLNQILQRRDKESSFNPSQDKNHRDLP